MVVARNHGTTREPPSAGQPLADLVSSPQHVVDYAPLLAIENRERNAGARVNEFLGVETEQKNGLLWIVLPLSAHS